MTQPLLSGQSRLAEIRRRVDAAIALSAAEIDRRSHRDLGYDGLAQRLGAGSAVKLIQQVSGVSRRDAGALVRIGSLDAASPLTAPVAAGSISVEAADVIRAGLGEPTTSVPATELERATAVLVTQVPTLTIRRCAAGETFGLPGDRRLEECAESDLVCALDQRDDLVLVLVGGFLDEEVQRGVRLLADVDALGHGVPFCSRLTD